MPPDARVKRLLRDVAQRLRWQWAARALSATGFVALLSFILIRRALPTLVIAAATAIALWWFTRRSRQNASALVEARVPECRNILVTAEALLAHRLHAKPEVSAVIMEDAAQRADAIAPATLWPWLRPALALAVVASLWTVTALIPIDRLAVLVTDVVGAASPPAIDHVDILVTPPEYSGRGPEGFTDPERFALLAGSRVRVRIRSTAAAVTLETMAGRQQAARNDDGVFSADVVVDSDSYLALTPASDDGHVGARRLIGITALPDRAPEVRITEPGKDLFLRSAATKPLSVRLQAEDDLGLRTIRLAYTKVAGAGESFTFTEGEAPVTIARTNDRQWKAAGFLPLDTMSLDVGDMVVYRAIAVDRRPGAAPVESDAFIVEIVSASDAMAEGFSIDERQDKYALSQQMVIIKTERLIAKIPTFSKDALIEQALGIAAEQRSVRAEIIFMMGGEFEDEEVEAGAETELMEGRTVNSGRADLGRATRAMSRAAAQLTDVDLITALASERAALVAMQRALSRRRFILRTLTQRLQIDDTRRLQGKLTALGRGERSTEVPSTSGLVTAARTALLAVTEVSQQPTLTGAHASQLSAAAAGLLTTEGGGAPVVDVASRLSVAAEAIVKGTPDVARRALADATTRLISIASAELTMAPSANTDPGLARLRGALADALRARGGR
ncbi:MAG TPA: DUF4175 family protein [Vicinamibacterales bacterium]|nr:DUF4175 family protein [Vicinamibacterales bacterium]